MYRYTQVGCEFLLLQLTSHIEKNTPLISQLLEESIRTSFQTSLDPEPSFPCMCDGPAACTYSSYQSRKRNQIKQYSFQNSFLLLQPSLYYFSQFPCTIDRDFSSSLTGPGAGSQISGPAPPPRVSYPLKPQHPAEPWLEQHSSTD